MEMPKFRKTSQIWLEGFCPLMRWLFKSINIGDVSQKCHGSTFAHFLIGVCDIHGPVTSSLQVKMACHVWMEKETE